MKVFGIVLLIMLAGIAAYANSFSGAFIFDDIHTLRTADRLLSLWHDTGWLVPTKRFATDLTFMANLAFSRKAADFHLVNLLIHLLTACGLFFFIEQALQQAGADRPQRRLIAAGTAVVWVCHPLTVSAVTYLSQRYECMMALAYTATLCCAARGLAPAGRSGWRVSALAICALGMATKEVMFTAPLAVAAYHWVFLRGPWTTTHRRFYAGLALTWAVPLLLTSVGSASVDASYYYSYGGTSRTIYLLTQAGVLLRYLGMSVWPAGLAFDYEIVPATLQTAWLPAIFVAGLLSAAVVGFLRRSPWGFAGLMCFLLLAPTSSIIPRPDFAVEHRMYLPLAGVLVLVLGGTWAGMESIGRCLAPTHRAAAARIFVALCMVMTLAGIVASRQRNDLFGSETRLWEHAVQCNPKNLRAMAALAAAHLSQPGDMDAGTALCMDVVRKACAIPRPWPAKTLTACVIARFNLGAVAYNRGRFEEASRWFSEALVDAPSYDEARQYLRKTRQMQRSNGH